MIKRIINKIKKYRNERSGEDYIRYLKSKGIKIGKELLFLTQKIFQ